MNRRVSRSLTMGRRAWKIEPYGTNARALNLSLISSSSRRTTNPRRLPPRQQHQPRKEEDRPTAHYVYPTKGRQPRDEEDKPKAHCVNQPKGYERRKRETGHRQLHLSSRLDGSCQGHRRDSASKEPSHTAGMPRLGTKQ